LSTILSGGIGSAIPLAGAAVKSVAQSAGKSIPKLKSVFTGVSADVEKTVLNKMPEIQQMAEKGTSAESAYLTHFSEELPKIDSMKSTFLDDAIKARQAALESNKVSSAVSSAEDLYKAIDEAKKKITPSGKAATSRIESRLADVLDAENRLNQYVADTMGIDIDAVKKLAPEERLLSGTALNDLNRQYYNSIDWSDSLGAATEVNSMFKKMGYNAAESLAKIDDSVRVINKKMSQALEAQEALKNYGLYNQGGIDTEKFVKFVNDNDKKWFFNKSHLQTLDEIWGTNLVDQVEVARAMKQIYPKDVFGAYATGRSLLESAGGAGLGLAVGGPVGAGVGIAAGMALQAPGLRQFRIKAANALENLITGREASAITRLGGSVGKVVPDRLVPFVSAKVSALSQLERAQNSVQNAINAGASSVFKNEDVMAEPTSIEALNKTNFGKGQVRPSEDRLAAFRKRAEEINDLMNNPSKLSDLVAKNTQDLHLIAPQVAQHIIEHGMNAVQALHAALPKTNANDPLKPGKVSDPSDFELSRFERVVDTIENPMRVLKDIKDGTMTQDQVTILKNVYPTIYMNMVNAVQIRAARVKEIPYGVRLKIATLLGQPTMTAQRPGVLRVLQTPATPDQVQKMKSPDIAGARETQVEGVLRR
ncbi:MAG TPA: hypothetical protein PKW79_00250, partial [Rhabdochlamydiaceae bacterium]|nr:hypothetical protein [Rhabdochlamydiaceae bacterium]